MKENHRIKELKSGDKFDKLTVISDDYTYANIKAKRILYQVRCDCGNEFGAIATKLRTGVTTSCRQCSYRDREVSRLQVSQEQQLFTRFVLNRAEKDGIEVTIELDDYIKLSSSNCFYCDDSPREVNYFSGRKYVNNEKRFINGLDRKDRNQGYTLENSIPCCSSCNYAKHVLNEEEFYMKIIKIYTNLQLDKYNFNKN